ncbi:methyltransferase [Legionella sainthelensi]|uniref:Methyltransferase n=1 Tax=Legionella sainthelensi TaxID=28087 RepID=A0A0W0YPF0_9GAMM|nr:class I SAM-dependent methyltransferase [Legionella sainthelensi]KTD58725.1 methyltransferase [Legionella sainthelensi]VEH34742.1 methyltransferase [Legionella sainthelensi]
MHPEDPEWVQYKAKFSEYYHAANYSKSLQTRAMEASHKLLEKYYSSAMHFDKVLEIGAGTGEHIKYIRHRYSQYIISDIDENVLHTAKERINIPHSKVSFEIQKGGELSYSDRTFDRIIACHVLEHIYMPHLVLKEWSRVLKPNGILSILIPTDPGLAWRLGRYFGARKVAYANGLAYDYIMAREHVNSCNNLIALLRHYFPNSKEAWWPFSIPSIDLNLFFAFHAKKI